MRDIDRGVCGEIPLRRRGAIFVVLLGWGCLAAVACGGEPATLEQPNVLLITVDTTRADYLGAYGHPEVQTPHIDELAASGALFLNAIAPSQTTNPAHASILTGLFVARHGVYDNQTPLSDDALTLAEVLQAEGYATLGAVSAPHLNPGNSSFGQGFDVFLEAEKGLNLTAGERNEQLFSRIRRVAGRRFFAWVHYFDAHGDYAPPAPYDSMYPRGDEADPIEGRDSMDLAPDKKQGLVDPDQIIPLYKGEITYMDSQIGALLRLLDELEITDRTLVVLVADHGESMTEKGIYFAHAGMYQQVLHVPLIMRLPGRIEAGVRVESLTSAVDVFPTVLDLLGIAPQTPELDGVGLLPTLENPAFQPHEFVVAEAVNGVIGALYMGGYKYVKPYPYDWSMPEDHLFVPAEDRREDRDLKQDEPGKVAAMETFLDAWIQAARATGLASTRHLTLDPETERALRSLGYIR